MSDMPTKYRLDDVSFCVGHQQATVPCVAVRWLDVDVGQTVGVAPHSAHGVRIGPTVPRWLNELRVNREPAVGSVRVRVRGPALRYMGAVEDDTLIAQRDGAEIIVQLSEVTPDD